MVDLTNTEEIKKLDPGGAFGSTFMLPEQAEVAWKEVEALNITQDFSGVNKIVCCGMGASMYGALVFKSLLGDKMPYPLEIVSDYHLPMYVDSNTLVILTSASGSTEETLSCAAEGLEKGAKMIALTRGGKLKEWADKNNVPGYYYDGKLNPSNVPRLGGGYSIVGLLALLQKIGIVKFDIEQIGSALIKLKEQSDSLKEKAMNEAKDFVGKLPIVIGAEHLTANALIMRNQFNETSKTFSAFYIVPDLNHHLMEGLAFPKNSNLVFIMINSSNYSDKIKKRMQLTEDVIRQNGHEVYNYETKGTNIYEDFLEYLAFGSYLTLYLSLLNEQNPAINPWVDYFKEKLAQ
ncbi:MAG TPA: SIS domain-containing protein [Patescibacteria group bacterium]|nr:SIS domain-containing protein [Patescibacteria group bacterium]